MRTIKVRGNSTLKIKPTLMRVSIEIKGLKKEFDNIVSKSAKDTETIKGVVEKLEFKREDLKTRSFDIQADYESYRDENGDYKSRFIGYKYTHDMYIEFPIDNKLLGNLLYALVKSGIEPKFKVGYTILDSEKAKYRNTLIENSVKNASEKAKILVKSANVSLGDIISIDYLDNKIDYYDEVGDYAANKMMSYAAVSEDTYNFDIEADDMVISDSVNMIWEIK